MLTFLIAAALLLPVPPRPVAAEAQLRAVEHAWITAAIQHDRSMLDRLLAADFVDISYRGERRTKADVLHAQAAPSGSRQILSDLQVRVYGETGIVTGVNTVTMTKRAPVRVRFTDVFVRTKDGWRAVSAQETIERAQ
jgi:ketosteroid isomerase-like protein